MGYKCPRCGTFYLDGLIAVDLASRSEEARFRLSAATRRLSDSGQRVEIHDTARLDGLIDSVPPWDTLMDGIDRLMLLLAGRATSFRSPVNVDPDLDYPLLSAMGPAALNELWSIAGELELYDFNLRCITISGWQRVDALRQVEPKARDTFVAMSFAPDLRNAYDIGFKPGVDDTQYFVAQRVDSQPHSEKIDDRIVAMIRRSGLVVADFTGDRGGVYFEAGLAMGLGIPVVWTCREDWQHALHFDTNHYPHIIWKQPEELRQRITDHLNALYVPRDALRIQR